MGGSGATTSLGRRIGSSRAEHPPFAHPGRDRVPHHAALIVRLGEGELLRFAQGTIFSGK